MIHLDLPPYIINMPFVDAIRNDNVNYIEGTLHHHPNMVSSLFYTVDEDRVLCLFEYLRQPAILLLSPFAYALLFGSFRVARFIDGKSPEAWRRTCVVADCQDSEGIWYNCHRVIEFSPIAIRCPSKGIYRHLKFKDFDFNAQQVLSCTLHMMSSIKKSSTTSESVWEYLWSLWPRMRDLSTLVDVTSDLLTAGIKANQLTRRVNLEKLYISCNKTKTSLNQFISFLYLLLFHGVDLTKNDVLGNFLNVVYYLTSEESVNMPSLQILFMAIYNLSNGCREYSLAVKELVDIMEITSLDKQSQGSLTMLCVRRIRSLACGPMFFRQISRLDIPREVKHIILSGLPMSPSEKAEEDVHSQAMLKAELASTES